MRRPRPKFKVSFYLYFCCFWINVTQIIFENIKRKIQRIISDSCFQLKSWFNVDARAPSIPLLNFPFKLWRGVNRNLINFLSRIMNTWPCSMLQLLAQIHNSNNVLLNLTWHSWFIYLHVARWGDHQLWKYNSTTGSGTFGIVTAVCIISLVEPGICE